MAIPVGTAVGYLTLDYSDFSKNLKTAVGEANQLSNKFADTLGSGLSTIGSQMTTVGTNLTTHVTLPLAAAAGASVKFGAEFDKGMSNVKAVSGATAEEFEAMREAAMEWGEKTVYTATEASDALYYMGLAGWDAQESMAGLGPVLSLAAAGNLELGRTSDIVTDAMTAMKLEAGEYTDGVENTVHFTNALAAAMANSNTDVDQMGEAFKYVAPLAGAANMEIDDLTLALGLMANVGVKASQAGTGLRQALKSVISPTDKAAGYMEQYGVSLFDAEGNAKSMRQFMEELRGTFGDLSVDIYDANGELKTGEQIMEEYGHSLPTSQQEKLNAIVQIFGTRALPGMLGIIEQSDEKFNDLANAIDSSDKAFVKHGEDFMTYQEAVEQFGEELVNTSDEFQVLGAAEGMAQVQMDNLEGDWIRFTSALGTTRIEITDLVKGALRELVQKLTELVQWFNNLDDEQQKNILRMAAIIAAIGPVLLTFGKLITFIGNTITAISTLKGAISKLQIGFNMLGTHLSKNIIEGFKLARAGFSGLGAEASPLGAALGSITLPMVAIGAAIAVVVAAFVHLMKTNEEFRKKVFNIWNGIKAKFQEAGQKITDAINAIGFNFDSITEVLKAGFDWLSNVLAPFILGIFDTLSDLLGGALDVISGFFEIIGGLFAGFRDGDWTMFVQGLLDFFGGLFTVISSPFILAFNVVTEYLTAFGTSWSEIWQGIKDFFIGIGTAISETVSSIWNSIKEWWDGLVQGFLDFHTNLWNSIGDFLYGIVSSVVDFVTNIINNVKSFIDIIQNKVTEMKMALIGKVIELVTTIVQRFISFRDDIVNKVVDLKNKVVSKVTELYNNVKAKMETMKNILKTIVSSIVTIFVNKFIEMKEKVVTKVTEIKNGIINIFKNIKDKFFEIGSNIIQGIADGIDAGWQWLTDKVSSLANDLFESAKSALGISSPSKVFRKGFGYWIPMGAAEGVEDSMPLAVRQIQTAFDKGLSQVTGEVGIDTSLNSMMYSVQDAIEEVTFWFESVEERLSNAVDNIRDSLVDLVDTGNSLVTPDGFILNVDGEPSDTLSVDKGGKDEPSGEVVNNYYYTFNSPKAIDEIEAARKFKETQRDLSEGF